MQTLLDAIQEFEKWSGIPVNAMKTKQMTVDGIEANREIVEELKYHDESLPIAPESESVRYGPLDYAQKHGGYGICLDVGNSLSRLARTY
jgi:hypothetical protein